MGRNRQVDWTNLLTIIADPRAPCTDEEQDDDDTVTSATRSTHLAPDQRQPGDRATSPEDVKAEQEGHDHKGKGREKATSKPCPSPSGRRGPILHAKGRLHVNLGRARPYGNRP